MALQTTVLPVPMDDQAASDLIPPNVSSPVIPAWITGLSDEALKQGLNADLAQGNFSEAAIAQALMALVNELSASQSGLSPAQFQDLQTVASHLGTVATNYVSYLVDQLVNGNPANAYWTGGASHAVSLGNLAVGTTATQLSELVGKWFYGTDLPSSDVTISGTTNGATGNHFGITYSAVNAPLFPNGGPSPNDVNQGQLGDCYLLSSLAEIAAQDPSIIESMITPNGNGTYGVRFFIDGAPVYVTVNNALPNGGAVFDRINAVSDPSLWVGLIEKAYAQLQAEGNITGTVGGIAASNSFSVIGNGGYPEAVLSEITNTTVTEYWPSANDSHFGEEFVSNTFSNSGIDRRGGSQLFTPIQLQSVLIADLAAGDDLVLLSGTAAADSAGKTTLVADHAMSILGFDNASQAFIIRNPWGVGPSQSWETKFEVTLPTLLSDGDWIAVDAGGSLLASSLNGSALLVQANQIYTGDTSLNTAVLQGSSQNFTISADIGSVLTTDRSGVLGTDTLNGFTTLQFTDQNLQTGWLSGAIQLNVSNPTLFKSLTELYIAYFDRAPDAVGLDYWASAAQSGTALTQIATSFASSPEFLNDYGNLSSQTSTSVLTAFVTTVYQNVLNRAPDSGGLTYWVNSLGSHQSTPATFLLDVISAVQGQNGTADAIYLAAKEQVGYHFAVTDGLTNATQAAAVLAQFNQSFGTVGASAAIASANALSDSDLAHVAATSELIVHLVGVSST